LRLAGGPPDSLGARCQPLPDVLCEALHGGMTPQLLSLGTAVPSARLTQSTTRDFFAAQPSVDRLTARLIGAAFDSSAIEHRYSVIGRIGEESALFTDGVDVLRSPSTGERNLLYRSEAPALSAAAAREALAGSGFDAADVTHVV